MTAVRALLAFVVLAAGPAQPQSWPPPVGPTVDPHRYQADQHRYEIDRLRAEADRREAFASRLQLESRLTRLEIEAARQPEPLQPPPSRAVRPLEQERSLRESATERRRAAAAGVGQIDAWLDRPAH
jgi:hypothetical protein